jgi:very-short-patch-repair endonuclease
VQAAGCHIYPQGETRLARCAARQHGVVSRAQLIGLGIGPDAIGYKLRIGRLHLMHRGVYAVGYRPTGPHARAMAAVLACGAGAALSHRSASALWGLAREWPVPAEVTCTHHRRLRGVCVRQTRDLRRAHLTSQLGIPVTRPARTLLDLAEVLDDAQLARAVNEARVRSLVYDEQLVTVAAAARGRHGAHRLLALLDHADGPTRSALEDVFLALVARSGLPRPEVNRRVGPYEVDALWRAHRLVVELDGFGYHRDRRSFERERERDAKLQEAGYRVVRITWRRISERPEEEVRRLRRLLEGRDRAAMPAP